MSESQGRTNRVRTIYHTEKSFMEKVVASAVDRLANLVGEGPLRFQLTHPNVLPGSLGMTDEKRELHVEADSGRKRRKMRRRKHG